MQDLGEPTSSLGRWLSELLDIFLWGLALFALVLLVTAPVALATILADHYGRSSWLSWAVIVGALVYLVFLLGLVVRR
jgi:MFS family permease